MNGLVVGSGPVAGLIYAILRQGNASTQWLTGGLRPPRVAKFLAATARLPAGETFTVAIPAPGPIVDATLAEILDQQQCDVLVVAQPPWHAIETVLEVQRHFCGRATSPTVFVSSNGLWSPRFATQGLTPGALTITANVEFDAEQTSVNLSPTGSGYMIGPGGPFTDYFLDCAGRVGAQGARHTSAESIVFSKCLVNIPLTLQYGLAGTGQTIEQLLAPDEAVVIEAEQVSEMATLMQILRIPLAATPGFPTTRLIRLSRQVTESRNRRDGSLDELRRLLLTWRQDRVPSIGIRVRRRDLRISHQIEWMWGAILSAAGEFGVAMTVTQQLRQRTVRHLEGNFG
jgi:hypothetical protein